MKVELDIFSGRPNPAWTLGPDERGELARRLRALPVAPASPAAPGGLGYRGLTVTAPASPLFGHLRALAGSVTVSGPGGARTLADPERGLERWLLRTGQSHLEEELYRELLAELAG